MRLYQECNYVWKVQRADTNKLKIEDIDNWFNKELINTALYRQWIVTNKMQHMQCEIQPVSEELDAA